MTSESKTARIGLKGDHENDRYVPKATGKGSGWGIYDRLKKCFVSDSEIEGIEVNEKLPTN